LRIKIIQYFLKISENKYSKIFLCNFEIEINIMHSELIYQIALTKISGVGDISAKNLISYCGSAEEVFKVKKTFLEKIPGIGKITAESIKHFNNFNVIEKEIKILEKHKITPLYYLNEAYPFRLKNCEDSPIMLYYKGNSNLNQQRIISIVGTRNATVYGKQFTEQLCEALSPYNVLIISGLASGTDTNAHKFCLKNSVETVGVLAHGLHTIYPAANRNLAIEMLGKGGLLTEFAYDTPGMKENFPKRNRIVAGMSDALIIIESGKKGGSLISAEIANSYNKDVYALPGRYTDTWSIGCNNLIQQNKAAIIDSIDQLIFNLGYNDTKKINKDSQLKLLENLSESELVVTNILKNGEKGIDDLHFETKINISQLAFILLDLEFKNIVYSLPGKMYGIHQ